MRVSLYIRNHSTRKYELTKPRTIYPVGTILVPHYGMTWETLPHATTFTEDPGKFTVTVQTTQRNWRRGSSTSRPKRCLGREFLSYSESQNPHPNIAQNVP